MNKNTSAGASIDIRSFHQKLGNQTATFVLEESGVQVRVNERGKYTQTLVPYSSIIATHTVVTYPEEWPKVAGVLIFFFSIVLFITIIAVCDSSPTLKPLVGWILLCLIILAILAEVYVIHVYKNYPIEAWQFPAGEFQMSFNATSNRPGLEAFLAAMNVEKMNYLHRRIQKMHALDESFAPGGALASLLNANIITEAQCSELERRLDLVEKDGHIGFGTL